LSGKEGRDRSNRSNRREPHVSIKASTVLGRVRVVWSPIYSNFLLSIPALSHDVPHETLPNLNIIAALRSPSFFIVQRRTYVPPISETETSNEHSVKRGTVYVGENKIRYTLQAD
ncbi:unnamed protein product, partial [Ectocarpus sp. 6 AP-2014]